MNSQTITGKVQIAAGTGKAKEIDNISVEDATAIVKHFTPAAALAVRVSDTHIKTMARTILRNKNIGVLDALILIEKEKSSQPKAKGF